jgi:hypothetical protein
MMFGEGVSSGDEGRCQFVLFDLPAGRSVNGSDCGFEIIGHRFEAQAVDRPLARERA